MLARTETRERRADERSHFERERRLLFDIGKRRVGGEAHQGRLTATRAPSGGARFALFLPIVGEPPSVPTEAPEAP